MGFYIYLNEKEIKNATNVRRMKYIVYTAIIKKNSTDAEVYLVQGFPILIEKICIENHRNDNDKCSYELPSSNSLAFPESDAINSRHFWKYFTFL